MKNLVKIPPRLTSEECNILENCFSMQSWQFDATIKIECTEIATSPIVYKNNGKEFNWEYAQIFGLKVMKVGSLETCIGNFFIRYQGRIYQTYSLDYLVEVIKIASKGS